MHIISQVHSGVCSQQGMAPVPEMKRKTCTYSFHREPLTPLIELSNLVTGCNQKVFVDQYGDILTLLKMVDYQLAPTLEEYSILMNVPIKYQVPFLEVPKEVDFRVVAKALYLSIKEEEAKKGNWEAFNAQLAIMIYRVVLFPSMPNFVDLAAITIFIRGNPVPTLLADTYYAIHRRHGKGGAIRCCLPLLLRWFLSFLPTSGPFMDTQNTHKWTQRIMSLTSYDIRWQAYRPLDAEIAESVYFEKRSDPARLERVERAWKTIGVKD
ncbi:hypothetical protein KIW84_022889 [Lathyrus oleraceus]|uniref:DUF7745 domain-containing protein n=1 Tax=Pisum sativum TaxID=3888 RepID=A0A9D4YCR4_PEA|nr:hypothetical protein KIW84_022889 [Pisum sativum]